ncbi:Protein p13 MTCP-1 [Myotis brandtii]|uniref:Protein p13 MTCP-1 n=1 Tax=Myotis brandtii TaxID=109478 RepID=S7PBQ5_MYOBR|nr:PREDICTED: protein p13 MTCP-1 [Myotis brandtii]EPQ07618.1 Protein p13 MTCP-1 [Myotis brandtii]
MAELPSTVHLTSHPVYLSNHGPLMYEDENQRTWLHFVMDTGGDLQVRLCQMNIPCEHITITTSPLTWNTMPSMWMLHLSSQYLDSMGRFWRIVHHVMEDDMEEMILELMDDS